MSKRYRVLTANTTDSQDASTLRAHRDTLYARLDTLYARLELGYERIERALAQGEEVETWEDFWVALLREYERVCDELQRDLAT
jgi:hypothetical protein